MSCVSASACTAVGSYILDNYYQYTLVEVWNGTAWQVTPTPDPAGAQGSSLSGVSCVSARACTAVGNYSYTIQWDRQRIVATLVEVWNGTAWQVTPAPSPDVYSTLSGVSCVSASACTAAGVSGGEPNNAGTQVTLAEAWNGTAWQVTPTPNPPPRNGEPAYRRVVHDPRALHSRRGREPRRGTGAVCVAILITAKQSRPIKARARNTSRVAAARPQAGSHLLAGGPWLTRQSGARPRALANRPLHVDSGCRHANSIPPRS